MSREDEIKNAKPGDHLVYGTREIRTLKNRKDGDDGWWFDDGSGLADHAYVNGFWLLLEQTPAFEAGRAAVWEETRQRGDVIVSREQAAMLLEMVQRDPEFQYADLSNDEQRIYMQLIEARDV